MDLDNAVLHNQKTFLDYFLGNMSESQWSFHLFLIFIGAIYYIIKRIENRKDKSSKLSIKKWFADTDNVLAVPGSIILAYISIRFYADYEVAFENWLPGGIKATPYIASIVLGFYLHKIAEKISINVGKSIKK